MDISKFVASYIDTIIILVLGLLSFWKSYYDFKKEYKQLPPNFKLKKFTKKGLLIIAYIIIVSFLSILKDYRANQSEEKLENKIDSLTQLNQQIKTQNVTFLDTLSKFGFILNKVDNSLIRLDSKRESNYANVLHDNGRPLITTANVPEAVTIKKTEGDNYTLSILLVNAGKLAAVKINADAFFLDNLGNGDISILKTKTSAIAPDDILYPDENGYYKQLNYGYYLKNVSRKDTSYIYIKIKYQDENNKPYLYRSVYYWIPEKGITAEKANKAEYDNIMNYLTAKHNW